MAIDDFEIRSLPLGYLLVIRACLDKLGVFAALDEHLPRHALAHASDAECLEGGILNPLSPLESRNHLVPAIEWTTIDDGAVRSSDPEGFRTAGPATCQP